MEIGYVWLCRPKEYEFEGVIFEISPMIGPLPLKKNGDPKKRAGKKFYTIFKRFDSLPIEEQKKYKTGGGCVRI